MTARRCRAPVALLATAVVVTACALAAPAAATDATTTTVWPPLRPFDPAITWAPCHDGWECGTLTVPVDWTRAAGGDTTRGTVPLALARLPASSPEARIGVLVVNPGGPGQGGTDAVPRVARRFPATVLDRFDLVTWDPRGTGASRPVDCVDDAYLDLAAGAPVVPETTEQLAVVRDYGEGFARGCKDRMGSYARHVGTRSSARDLEAIRIALGEPAISYLGFSYGTVLGMTYAQMYPSVVRAMVLDGPPDYWLAALDYAYAQANGFTRALDAFLTWCEGESSCRLRDAGAPRETFDALRTTVRATPLAAEYRVGDVTRAGPVTENVLATAVFSALYDERAWPTLGQALARAAGDGDGSELLALADDYLGRDPGGAYSSLVEANAVIRCVDLPDRTPRSVARELADVRRFQADLPPWGGNWATSGCAGMPKPARSDVLGDVRVAGTPPLLVVGTTGDPATPYPGAVAILSRIAGAGLLTFESTDHTAFGTARSTCIDDAVTAYLVDVALPAPDTRC